MILRCVLGIPGKCGGINLSNLSRASLSSSRAIRLGGGGNESDSGRSRGSIFGGGGGGAGGATVDVVVEVGGDVVAAAPTEEVIARCASSIRLVASSMAR